MKYRGDPPALRLLVAWAILVAVLSGIVIAADYDQHLAETDCLSVARTFLKTFYPELKGHNYLVTVGDRTTFDSEGPLRWFGIALYGWSNYPNIRPQTPKLEQPVFSASFLFDPRDGRLREFQRTVPRGMETLKQTLQEHPEWNDEQVNQALEQSGAKYAPRQREALLRSIHADVERLAAFVGPIELKPDSLEFSGRELLPRVVDGKQMQNICLDWRIEAVGRTPKGQQHKYSLRYEPMNGDLISFTELD